MLWPPHLSKVNERVALQTLSMTYIPCFYVHLQSVLLQYLILTFEMMMIDKSSRSRLRLRPPLKPCAFCLASLNISATMQSPNTRNPTSRGFAYPRKLNVKRCRTIEAAQKSANALHLMDQHQANHIPSYPRTGNHACTHLTIHHEHGSYSCGIRTELVLTVSKRWL